MSGDVLSRAPDAATVNSVETSRRNQKQARHRYRDAGILHAAYLANAPLTAEPQLCFAHVSRLIRQRRIAVSKRWLGAKAKIEQRLVAALEHVRAGMDELTRSVSQSASAPTLSIQDAACDLAALNLDFPAVSLDRRHRTLSVTTEAIELDGVDLGPFEICLRLQDLGQSSAYSIIAKDPHPAGTSCSTTHPHVCDERLCEGDGHAAIQRSLREGRLFDFFVIVRQVLQTYNPHSAYVTLADWDGVECTDCGDTVSANDSDCCNRCDGRTCHECGCQCNGCGEVYCDDCSACCEGCDSQFCSRCLNSCDLCENPFCDTCLKEGRCDDCLEKETERQETEEATPAEAEVLATRLGETSLPA